jgi:hypothetical protein
VQRTLFHALLDLVYNHMNNLLSDLVRELVERNIGDPINEATEI